MDKFYYKPYIRASAYLMGLWSGMFYNAWKDKDETVEKIVNKVTGSVLIRTLFYLVGIGLISTIVWVAVPYQKNEVIWSTVGQAFYNSLNRVGFILGIMLVTFPAMFGCKNDPCHIILGSWIWSPIAKVSFCMYLVHFIVLMMGVFSNRMDMYWQYSSMLYAYVADVFWSILLATLLSVLVESPILGIEKILMRGGDKKKEKVEPEPKRIEFVEDSSLTQPLQNNEDKRVREEL
jgi:peptidoglycan/LPS O-acetylase OafA/YrhL